MIPFSPQCVPLMSADMLSSSCFAFQGLRLNCALLFLSLSNNQIGDPGAAQLAAVSIYMNDFNLRDNAFKSAVKLF